MRPSSALFAALALASFVLGAGMPAAAQAARAPAPSPLDSDPANWPNYAGDTSSKHHSPLKQINAGNVGTLQTQWVYGVYMQRDMQANPIVVNGVMYISATNRIDAIDARTGSVIWKYQRPPISTGSQRGTAYYDNKVFVTGTDKHLLALDARNGAVIWDVTTADGMTSAGQAPMITKNGVLIISGNNPNGFVQGYDAKTGKHLWTWSAIPKKGVKEHAAALATWGGAEPDGGPVWLTGSYDPELNLIYYGTGQPEPQWFGANRPGDNLWSDSVVAINPDTGVMKWYFQFTPHDVHDWDAGQMSILTDEVWQGKPRKLMLWANRNGHMYVLDRTNGEFLQAKPFVKVNWLTAMDAKGRPTPNEKTAPSVNGAETCPSTAGATNWPSPSYDKATKTFFLVVQEGCSINFVDSKGSNASGGYTESAANPWQLYTRAYDPFTLEKKWEYKQTNSIRYGPGLLSTEGGVVFTGEKAGQISALDAKTGKPLWHFFTGGVITSGPMTYQIDGRQYIGLVSGSNVFSFALPEGGAR